MSGEVYQGAVIVTPEKSYAWPVVNPAEPLAVSDFDILASDAAQLDVVLVGCGPRMEAIPFALRQALKERGLAVEFMDTGAACRTYNVLMAEGRRVAAALLPV